MAKFQFSDENEALTLQEVFQTAYNADALILRTHNRLDRGPNRSEKFEKRIARLLELAESLGIEVTR